LQITGFEITMFSMFDVF